MYCINEDITLRLHLELENFDEKEKIEKVTSFFVFDLEIITEKKIWKKLGGKIVRNK